MKNLEQIRARNALNFAEQKRGQLGGKEGGKVITKLPSLILNHGLLATAAYSYTEDARAWELIFDAIASHLADAEIRILPPQANGREKMMAFLTGNDATSETLKLATAEAMAWLAFARRFVKHDEPTKKLT